MKKKILLFNYFVMKCVQKEHELHGVKNFQMSLLALVLSYSGIIRRYPTGCSLEQICFCNRYYLEDLLLCLCVNAHKNGDDLFSAFDFKPYYGYRGDTYSDNYVADAELDKYLENLLPAVKNAKDIDYDAYQSLVQLTPDELLKESYHLGNVYKVNASSIEVAKDYDEIWAIDRAWDRMAKDDDFNKLFNIRGKHTPSGVNQANVFLSHFDNQKILKERFAC